MTGDFIPHVLGRWMLVLIGILIVLILLVACVTVPPQPAGADLYKIQQLRHF